MKHLNPIDKIMFDRRMFNKGTWGADFHPELKPDENTFVLAPHKGLSNFWPGDTSRLHKLWIYSERGNYY